MHEVDEAAKIIQRAADEEANIIFGTVLDEDMGDDVKITVIATGFDKKDARPAYEVVTPKVEARAHEVRHEPGPLGSSGQGEWQLGCSPHARDSFTALECL